MKNILIDTDIGIDCDDAVAIASAIYLSKKGAVNLLGVSTCARDNATASVSAIADYYNVNIPVARSLAEKLECDKTDNYATALKEIFNSNSSNADSIKFLRKRLLESQDKVILIAVGPLTVISGLLESESDEISQLNGVELVRDKVEIFYSMAGNFAVYDKNTTPKDYFSEWNVYQDIKAAKNVVNKMPIEVVFCPYEIGSKIFTGQYFDKNGPVGTAIKLFFDNNPDEFRGVYARESWDPITVLSACGEDLCVFSDYGVIEIADSGLTSFKVDTNGTHRYLKQKYKPKRIAKKLNKLYKELEKSK